MDCLYIYFEESMTFSMYYQTRRFVKMEDRKKTLVSRLLQYAIVHEVVGIPYEEIIIKRTLEGKPYLVFTLANYFLFL